MVNKYIPRRGDLLYIDDIPAIVISNDIFNMNTRMIIVCPIYKYKRKNFYQELNYKRFINQAINHLNYELAQEEKQIVRQLEYELNDI